MKQFRHLSLAFAALFFTACSYPMSMTSLEGEKFFGRYRLGREDSGLMQMHGPENEVLIGRMIRVDRTVFAQDYEKSFGRGSIDVDGPDLSRHSAALGGLLGRSSAFHETAYAEPADKTSGQRGTSVSGPLFYWLASLQGDRRLAFGCFLIGSAYTGHGIGRCKSQSGKEYNVEF